MRLTPRDVEKLMLHTACVVAQKRYARGLLLNYPETIALISGQLVEFARDGHSLAELTELGTKILGTDDVMPGVVEMIDEVQVEATLVDGTKLISVHKPLCHTGLSADLALYASGLSRTDKRLNTDNSMHEVPGEVQTTDGAIEINAHRPTITLTVTNAGSRPVQVGSHCNFVETNRALRFDRVAAIGYRLNIAAGTAIRFEPGETKEVELVGIGGEQIIHGGNGVVDAAASANAEDIADKLREMNFIG